MVKQKRPSKEASLGRTKKQKGPQYIPLPEAASDEEEGALSDEDMHFVSSHTGNLGFLERLPKNELDRAVSQAHGPKPRESKRPNSAQQDDGGAAAKHTAGGGIVDGGGGEGEESDEGEEYERRPRAAAQEAKKARPKGLPIKTLEGDVLFQQAQPRSGAGGGGAGGGGAAAAAPAALAVPAQLEIEGVTIQDDLEEQLQREREEAEERAAAAAAAAAATQERRLREEKGGKQEGAGHAAAAHAAPGVLAELAAYHDAAQRREAAKLRMAAAAQAVLGDPEGKLGEVRVILDLLGDQDSQVRRLAMLSAVAVFKDILPGYRIRPPTEKEAEVVVSKEVKRVREYEQALLRAYQTLLRALREHAQRAKGGQAGLLQGRIAVKCMATLLVSLPHFNYASDLLQALVPVMLHRDVPTREAACDAVRAVVCSDLEGSVSVEAVQLVADLVRRRKCVVPPQVVQPLLGMHFSEIGSAEEFEDSKRQRRGKKKKKKGGAGRDEVERGFQESQAVASREVRRVNQSQILEALFELFFRVLKACTASGLVARTDGAPLPASRFSRKFPLLMTTLEGLAKFAHLISVDYFSDLMAVLHQVLASSALPPRERVRCLLTVAHILQGQGESLTVDRRGFYTQLYAAVQQASLVPLLEEEGEGGDACGPGLEQGSVEVGGVPPPGERLCSLLSALLERMLLDSKLLDITRQGAFAKRMAASAASAGDTGTAMGLLCVLHRMLRRQAKLRGMLENEGGGLPSSQTFRPDVGDPGEAGALAVPLWELSVLGLHYHPHVAQASQSLARMASGPQGAGCTLLPMATTPPQLAARYSTATGGFNPAPAAASGPSAIRKKGGRQVAGEGKGHVEGVASGAEEFLTAVQLRAAQEGLLPVLPAQQVGCDAGPAGLALNEGRGEEGVLSLPGWGVGDAVAGEEGGEACAGLDGSSSGDGFVWGGGRCRTTPHPSCCGGECNSAALPAGQGLQA